MALTPLHQAGIFSEQYNFETKLRNDGPNGLFAAPLDELITNRRPIDSMMGTTIIEYGYYPHANETVNEASIAYWCKHNIDYRHLKNEKSVLGECILHYTRADPTQNRTTDFWAQRVGQVRDEFMFYAPCYKEADSLREKGANAYIYSFDYKKQNTTYLTPYHSFDTVFVIGLNEFE